MEMKEVKYVHGDCLVGFAMVENVGVQTKMEVPSHLHTQIQPGFWFSRCTQVYETGNGKDVDALLARYCFRLPSVTLLVWFGAKIVIQSCLFDYLSRLHFEFLYFSIDDPISGPEMENKALEFFPGSCTI